MQKIKNLFKSVNSKRGTYSVGVTAIFIGIVIVFNMIVGQLPENIRQIDISDTNIYDISSTSKTVVKGIEDKVVINMIADKSTVDDRIKTFVKKYASLSNKISIKWIDPVLHPTALTDYNTEENSIVVSCEKTGKMTSIPFTDIIQYDETAYYTNGTYTEKAFDAEGQLTSAVNYVTSVKENKIYRTSGHGESTFSTAVSDLMTKSNISVTELNLMMDSKIPDDCDLLMMYAPTTDITSDEKKVLSDYLTNGGKIMILLGDTDKETPNLEAILEEYGMQLQAGYIADTQRSYQGNYYYLIPNLSVSDDMAKGITADMVLVINSRGLLPITPARDTITLSSFLTTSESAYAVSGDNKTAGTFTIGAVATEDLTKDDAEAGTSRLTVFAGSTIIDSSITDAFSTLENLPLFMNAVTSNFENTQNVSIEAKSLTVTNNTVANPGLFSMLIIFGIPLIILISGFVVWYRRRKA